MRHYAIALDYNFNRNAEGGRITEYFLPYSLTDLNKLEFKGKVGDTIKRLNEDWRAEEYPLDALIADNFDYTESEFISFVEEDDHPQYFFDDELEKLPAFRKSLWDILSDAGLMKFAADSCNEDRLERQSEINGLAEITFCSQIELCLLKTKISILTHFENALARETRIIRNERINVRRTLWDIEVHEATRKALRTGDADADFPEGYRFENDEPISYYHSEVAEIESDIQTILSYNRTEGADPEQVRLNWISLEVLEKRLEKAIIAPYKRACELFEVIGAVREHRFIQRTRKTIPYLRAFLNERYDQRFAYGSYWGDAAPQETIDCIARDVTFFNNHADAVVSNDYGSGGHLDDINSYVGSDITSRYIRDKYHDDKGCFALLITKARKHYFSFSGMTEELKLPNGKLVEPVRYIMKNILNKCPIPNILAHNYKYNFAYISHSLDVRRYTDIVHGSNDYIGTLGPYIDPPETYKDDYTMNPNEDYGSTYACCERKMMAYSGYDNVRYIFSRWAPCWKCCPAIVEANGARVFAFATSQEFDRAGGSIEWKIKEYVVNGGKAYSVSTK